MRSLYRSQHIGQRATGLGIDDDLCVVEVGNLGRGLLHPDALVAIQNAARLVDLHAWPFKHQLAGQAVQLRPGQLAGVQQRRGHVGIAHIAHRRHDAEKAAAGFAKRHIPQVALQLKLHIAGLAGQHRIAHIVARLRRYVQRQIAVYLGAIGPAERAFELQHTGEARFGAGRGRVRRMPGPARLPGRMRVGKAHAVRMHLDLLALHCPAELGVQRGHGDQRVFKHMRQVERAIGKLHAGRAAAGIGVQHQVQPAQACRGVVGTQHQAAVHVARGIGADGRGRHAKGQLGHIGLHAPVLHGLGIAAPAGGCGANQARRTVGSQPLARGAGDGQRPRQLGQRGNVQPLGAGLGLAGLLALGVDVVDAPAAARPLLASGGFHRQLFGKQLKAGVIRLPAQPPVYGLQQQNAVC